MMRTRFLATIQTRSVVLFRTIVFCAVVFGAANLQAQYPPRSTPPPNRAPAAQPPAVPQIGNVSPNVLARGAQTNVGVNGRNFTNSMSFMLNCGRGFPAPAIVGVKVYNPSQAIVVINVPKDAAVTQCALQLGQSTALLQIPAPAQTNTLPQNPSNQRPSAMPGQVGNPGAQPAAVPQIGNVSPNVLARGAQTNVGVTGRNFTNNMSFTLNCGRAFPAPTIVGARVYNPGQAIVVVNVPKDAAVTQCALQLGQTTAMLQIPAPVQTNTLPQNQPNQKPSVTPGAVSNQNRGVAPGTSVTQPTATGNKPGVTASPSTATGGTPSTNTGGISTGTSGTTKGGTGGGNAKPVLTSVVPSSVDPGTTVHLSIKGKDFKSDDQFTVDCGYASLSNVQVTPPTQAQATLQLPRDASGACQLRLGESTLALHISGGAAEITGVSPSTVPAGSSVYVAISGNGFKTSNATGTSGIGARGGGPANDFNLKCGNDKKGTPLKDIKVLSSTQASAQVDAPNKAGQQCELWLANSSMVPLQIGKQGDQTTEISGVSPQSVNPSGANVQISITGRNLPTSNSNTKFTLTCGEDISEVPTIVTSRLSSATQASVTLKVPQGAAGGQCQLWLGQAMAPISITGHAGGKNAAVLTSVVPSSVAPGTTVHLSIQGKDFKSDDQFTVDCGYASLSNIQVTPPTQAQATLQLPRDASGACKLRLGESTLALHISGGAAEITGVSPSTVPAGSSVYVAISGNGFKTSNATGTSGIGARGGGQTNDFNLKCGNDKKGTPLKDIKVLSSTQASAQVDAPNKAGQQCELWLANSSMVPLQIGSQNDQTTEISGVSPQSVNPGGANVQISITGRNLPTSNSNTKFTLTCGEDISEVPTIVTSRLSSATQASVTLKVPQGAAGGQCQLWLGQAMAPISITGHAGGKNAAVLTSVVPSSVDPGTTVYLTIQGKDFKSDDQFTVDCGYASLSNIQITPPGQAQATLQLPRDASGACKLRLGESTLALHISGGAREITGVSPATVPAGSSVYVAISGNGFVTTNATGPGGGRQANDFNLKCGSDKKGTPLKDIKVLSSTQASAQVDASGNKAGQQCELWLGTSSMVPLQIGKQNDQTTEISGVSPQSVKPGGANVKLSITGRNLPTAKNGDSTGNKPAFTLTCNQEIPEIPTVVDSRFTSDTQASVTLQVPQGAAGGQCQLWLGQAMAPFSIGR
ncbi:MAG TPA: hypothetical protein VN176_09550 [Verrucomicrobiae bacterium]|nr:hypothetical protein [Verrucomicrobiae bacterium]